MMMSLVALLIDAILTGLSMVVVKWIKRGNITVGRVN